MKNFRSWCIAFFVGFISSGLLAVTSNRDEIRAELSQGYHVVWGHNFTEGDWAEGTYAIGASIAAENPGPFLAWFDAKLEQSIAKIQSNLPGVAANAIKQWILDSLDKKRVVTYNGFKIYAGFATYQRWERIIYDEPQTYECKWKGPFGTWTWGFCTRSVQKERKVPLPNHHQFYIRFQFVNDNVQGAADYHRLYVKNSCHKPVYVGAMYKGLNNAWSTQGFWLIQPGKSAYVANTRNNIFYFTGQSQDSQVYWQGSHSSDLFGKRYSFREVNMNQNRFVRWTLDMTCKSSQVYSHASSDELGNTTQHENGGEGGELEPGVPEDDASGDGWDNDPQGNSGDDGWDQASARSDSWGQEGGSSDKDWENVDEEYYSGLSSWDSLEVRDSVSGEDDGWD